MVTFSRLGYCGHLGNQLFQVATVVAYAARLGKQFRFPLNDENQDLRALMPHLKAYFLTNRISAGKVWAEPTFHYTEIPLGFRDEHDREIYSLDLHGYFQSEKYWKDQEAAVRQVLFLPESGVLPEVSDVPADRLWAVHVRRGDYLKFPRVFAQLGPAYYKAAVQKAKDRGASGFLVFSDDIHLAKKDLAGVMPEETLWMVAGPTARDFQLMASCSGVIMANSSFSWWASYLGRCQTVAPKDWFAPGHHESAHDIYREDMTVV